MRFANSDILISTQANQFKTLEHIDKVAKQGQFHPFIQKSIQKFKLNGSRDSLKKVAKAGFNIATFYPDPKENQYIRTVNRFLKDRRGNCVDYTVFISSFLRALKVPHIIRMVSFDPRNPRAYSHIYPVTTSGYVLDLVNGQDQNGLEGMKSKEDRTFIFNKEVPFVGKFDKLVNV